MTIKINQNILIYITLCSKTVVIPPQKFGRTRAMEGHVLNENLWPNVQLDVIRDKMLLQGRLKTFTSRVFSCYLPNLARLFFDLYLAFKSYQNTFFFNHQIKSKSSLDCKMTRIQSLFPKGWYCTMLLPLNLSMNFLYT